MCEEQTKKRDCGRKGESYPVARASSCLGWDVNLSITSYCILFYLGCGNIDS